MKDPIVQQVVDKYLERSAAGINKYGTTLKDNPLTTLQWLKHAQEEVMDMALYLERLIEEESKTIYKLGGYQVVEEESDALSADEIKEVYEPCTFVLTERILNGILMYSIIFLPELKKDIVVAKLIDGSQMILENNEKNKELLNKYL